jgi:HTH-type transcriptional regulator, competence development regulator
MTPFGKMLRQERKDRAMVLADMAKHLGISSPYLSQLETGAKPLKEPFVEKVIRFLDLNQTDAEAMRRAAAASLPATVDSVTIDLRADSSARDRELASHLALQFNRLKPETKAKLHKLLEDAARG